MSGSSRFYREQRVTIVKSGHHGRITATHQRTVMSNNKVKSIYYAHDVMLENGEILFEYTEDQLVPFTGKH